MIREEPVINDKASAASPIADTLYQSGAVLPYGNMVHRAEANEFLPLIQNYEQ
jgi:hypothetical protein